MPEELKPLPQKLLYHTDILYLQGRMMELCIARDGEEMDGNDEKVRELQSQINRLRDTIEHVKLILKEQYNVEDV